MTQYILHFDEIGLTDVALVGGKGANLGEMTRAGLPVPPGFCIRADAYRAFTAPAQGTIDRILSETRMEEADHVESQSTRLREFLMTLSLPSPVEQETLRAYRELAGLLGTKDLRVAVRSSATAEDLPDASFAGQQDTYLNVRGEESLLEHVKRCWASLWTARAMTYRHTQGYAQEQVALAVVVQAMIESEVAGILFTANPVNDRRDEMVLNASWGLGEAIVSGLVTPDTWIVKAGGEILERDIARKEIAIEYAPEGGTDEVAVAAEIRDAACLTDAQVQTLARLGERVAQHYARPMDIEWAYARENFYMLQARPITTLDGESAANKRQAPSVVGEWVGSFPVSNLGTGEYNRSMFIEIFPDPLSPAFLSVIAPLFGSMLAFTFETLGLTPPTDIPAIGVFYNQPYFHREYIQAALAPFSPPVQQALVTQIVNPFGKHERKLPTEASPAFLGLVTRLLRFMTTFPKQLPPLLAAYQAEIARFQGLPFAKLPEYEIMMRVRALLFTHAAKLLNYDFLMIALIGITYQMLGTLLERYYGDDSEPVRAKLISGVTGNITMRTNIQLWNLAQEAKRSPTVREILLHVSDGDVRRVLQADGEGRIFLAELDAFLEQYGHREVRMDILYPTWGEDPAPVLQFLRGYFDADERMNPLGQQTRLVREREQLAHEVDEHVQRDLTGRIAVAPLFHWVLKNTQAHTRERDTMHFELTRLFPPFRRALLELGARWHAQGMIDAPQDVFFMTLDEMERMAGAAQPMQEIVRERRVEFERNAQRTPPAVLREGVAVEVERAQSEDARGGLRGIAGSPGVARGIVRIVRGPHEFEKLKRGEILVAPLTNPVWTPLFAIAGGIITQVGGILSHGAIVAREYGIPAVMAVPDATNILQDGEWVTVDGDRGMVIPEE